MKTIEQEKIVLKPVFRWAGGKTQLLPEIEKRLPQTFNHFFEPFVGAGSVFMHLKPENATINDLNSELIDAYIAIRDDLPDLIELLTYHKGKDSEEYYYELRGKDREECFIDFSTVQRAARAIYLNKTNFNGLFRVNARGQFNVPYGHLKNPSILNVENLKRLSDYLNQNNINIVSMDYETTLRDAKLGDFVYLDPPYHNTFVGYQAKGFGEEEQIRLKRVFDELTDRGVLVILSNSSTDFIKDLYKDYPLEEIVARRSISAQGKARGNVSEVIVRNYA